MLTEAIRLLLTLAFTIIAAQLAKNIASAYVSRNIALILFIIIGAGLGFVIGGLVGRRVTAFAQWLEHKTKSISSAELMTGTGGLIIGLVAASLLAKFLEDLLKPISIITPYSIAITYISLGYIGFNLFVNRQITLDWTSNTEKSIDKSLNVLDTSVIIDGRLIDIIKAGFVQGTIIVPRFVVSELQTIADSADDLRRARGRRGLDVLQELRKQKDIKVELLDKDYPSLSEVDDKLIKLSLELNANLISNDHNLCKVALLENVRMLNLNDLAQSLKPVVIPGESFTITVIKEGKEKDQGVGYLDDGTMIVVEDGKNKIGQTVEVIVNSVLQTSAGKLIFTKLKK